MAPVGSEFNMVISKEKQMVQKFVKWLYRKECSIINERKWYEYTEEESLQFVDKFWEQI